MESFKDIILRAELPVLIYANGYAAQIVSQKEGKDQDGNNVWDMWLNPTPELIKRYELKINSDGSWLYKIQLPYDLVIQLKNQLRIEEDHTAAIVTQFDVRLAG